MREEALKHLFLNFLRNF